MLNMYIYNLYGCCVVSLFALKLHFKNTTDSHYFRSCRCCFKLTTKGTGHKIEATQKKHKNHWENATAYISNSCLLQTFKQK